MSKDNYLLKQLLWISWNICLISTTKEIREKVKLLFVASFNAMFGFPVHVPEILHVLELGTI